MVVGERLKPIRLQENKNYAVSKILMFGLENLINCQGSKIRSSDFMPPLLLRLAYETMNCFAL